MTPDGAFLGLNTGTFAVEITKGRSTTGAESNPSLPSNIITVSASSVRVEFPAAPIDGTDFWNIYVTPNGFANTGPFLFLQEVLESDLTDKGKGSINTGVSTTTWTRTVGPSGGHTLTANDVGKQIIIVGAGPAGGTLTTTIDAVNVGLQTATIHDAASTSVTNATTTFNSFVGGIPRAIEIEWSDGQLILSQKPPIDHDPPPSGSFVAAIGDTMNVAGCFGGVGWAASDAGQPEAFNPDNVSFLPEPAVLVLGRPQDGYLWVVCRNSISAAVYTGAVVGPPVMIKTLWDRVGCAGFTAAAVWAKVLYLFTLGNKIARIDLNGNLDFEFARRVADDISAWDPTKVVCGYDDNRRAMVFLHLQEAVLYHIELDKWGKINLAQVTGAGNPTGNVTSAYSQDGRLYLLAFESGQYNIYLFDQIQTGFGSIDSVGAPNTWTRVSGYSLVAGDVGKTLVVQGAGPGGVPYSAVITAVNVGLQQATLALDSGNGSIDVTVNPQIFTPTAGHVLSLADVNRRIDVIGAGPAAATLKTYITFVDVDAQMALLADAATLSVVATSVSYGGASVTVTNAKTDFYSEVDAQFTTGWQNAVQTSIVEVARAGQDRKTTQRILIDYSSPMDFVLNGDLFDFAQFDPNNPVPVGEFSIALPAANRMSQFISAYIQVGRLFALNLEVLNGGGQKFYALQVIGKSSSIK
jgi:hypothetical protein